jgi:hypothetical protein
MGGQARACATSVTGDAAYRETLLEASRIASALEDAELAAKATLANNRGTSSVFGQVDDARLAAIERAIELDDPPEHSRRAPLFAGLRRSQDWVSIPPGRCTCDGPAVGGVLLDRGSPASSCSRPGRRD